MNLAGLLHPLAKPARDFGRGVALDVAAVALAVGLAATGGGFLVAAGFCLLAHAIGPIAAAALLGTGLIALAALVLLTRQTNRLRHQQELRAQQAAQQAERDPLASLVFDLAYIAGRQIFGRR